jgi:hypothetical protein
MATSQHLTETAAQSGSQTLTATEGVSFVRADDLLTAFLELERAIRACSEFCLTSRPTFRQTWRRQTSLNQAEGISPRWVLRLFRTRNSREATQRGKERKNHESTDSTQNTNFTMSLHPRPGLLAMPQSAQAVIPAPDGGYPGATRQKGKTRSSISPPAASTLPLVSFRLGVIPPAGSIQPLGPAHYLAIRQTEILR